MNGQCEGAPKFQNNDDVLSIEEKTNQFAVFIKERTCLTPVYSEWLDENRGACKEYYTGFPVDVNKAHNGTLGGDILTIQQRRRCEVSACYKSPLEGVERHKANECNLEEKRIEVEQGKTEPIDKAIRANSMVDLKCKEDTKTTIGVRVNCNDVNDIPREVTNTKIVDGGLLDNAIDVDMENLMLFEQDLSSLDGYFNIKKEQVDDHMFDSFSVKQTSYSSLDNTALPNELTLDFTSDFSSDFASYLGTFSAPNSNQENEADIRVRNPDLVEEELRTDQIRLLTEALRTRSFAPIVYLLSILTKDTSECLSGASSVSGAIPKPDIGTSSDDELSIVSSLSDKNRHLSTQVSCDSDQSSILSDGRFGKRLSECDFSDVLGGGADVLGCGGELQCIDDQSIDFLTLESRKESQDDSNESDVVNAIDNILASDSACDLKIFRELLEKDCTETTSKDRLSTKVWIEASTDTNQVKENSALEDEILRDSQTDMDHLSMSKQPTPRVGPNRCYHLWDFLKELLDNDCSNVVVWTDQSKNEFKLLDTKLLAELWGQKKKLPNMNYDKLSRSLRYYIKLDILRKVPGKRLHFQFGKGRMWKKMKK